MSGPHDKLFRRAFAEPAVAAAHFRDSLPAAIVSAIDLDKLRLVPGSFVDDALRNRHTDLLFAAPWLSEDAQVDPTIEPSSISGEHDAAEPPTFGGSSRGRGADARVGVEALFYILFEHQSSVDPLMPWRMLRYAVKIWDRWLLDNPNASTLPAIVPLVLYNGRTRWTGPLQFQDLIHIPTDLRKTLSDYTPRLRIVLQWLKALVELPGMPQGQLALSFLRHRGDGDMTEQVGRSVALLLEIPDDARLRVLRHLLEYLGMFTDSPDVNAISDAVEPLGHEAQEVAKTFGERMIAQGEAQGEGRALARVKGHILDVLRRRDIPITEDEHRRIAACTDFETAMIWHGRSINAKRARDIFDD